MKKETIKCKHILKCSIRDINYPCSNKGTRTLDGKRCFEYEQSSESKVSYEELQKENKELKHKIYQLEKKL